MALPALMVFTVGLDINVCPPGEPAVIIDCLSSEDYQRDPDTTEGNNSINPKWFVIHGDGYNE